MKITSDQITRIVFRPKEEEKPEDDSLPPTPPEEPEDDSTSPEDQDDNSTSEEPEGDTGGDEQPDSEEDNIPLPLDTSGTGDEVEDEAEVEDDTGEEEGEFGKGHGLPDISNVEGDLGDIETVSGQKIELGDAVPVNGTEDIPVDAAAEQESESSLSKNISKEDLEDVLLAGDSFRELVLQSAEQYNKVMRKLIMKMRPYAKRSVRKYRGDMMNRKIEGQFGAHTDVKVTPDLALVVDLSGSTDKKAVAKSLGIFLREVGELWNGRMVLHLLVFASKPHYKKVVIQDISSVKRNAKDLVRHMLTVDIGGGTQWDKAHDLYKRKIKRQCDLLLFVTDFQWREGYEYESSNKLLKNLGTFVFALGNTEMKRTKYVLKRTIFFRENEEAMVKANQ